MMPPPGFSGQFGPAHNKSFKPAAGSSITPMMRPPSGQAQPQQPQQQGTQYNPQQGMNFAAWQGGGQNTQSFGMSPGQRDQAMSAWTMPKQQLLQFGQSMPQVPQYQPQQGADPQQLGARNAALVQQINNAGASQQVGTFLGQGAPPANFGSMQLNQQQMLRSADKMVQQGFRNPFGPPPPARRRRQEVNFFRPPPASAPPGDPGVRQPPGVPNPRPAAPTYGPSAPNPRKDLRDRLADPIFQPGQSFTPVDPRRDLRDRLFNPQPLPQVPQAVLDRFLPSPAFGHYGRRDLIQPTG